MKNMIDTTIEKAATVYDDLLDARRALARLRRPESIVWAWAVDSTLRDAQNSLESLLEWLKMHQNNLAGKSQQCVK